MEMQFSHKEEIQGGTFLEFIISGIRETRCSNSNSESWNWDQWIGFIEF